MNYKLTTHIIYILNWHVEDNTHNIITHTHNNRQIQQHTHTHTHTHTHSWMLLSVNWVAKPSLNPVSPFSALNGTTVHAARPKTAQRPSSWRGGSVHQVLEDLLVVLNRAPRLTWQSHEKWPRPLVLFIHEAGPLCKSSLRPCIHSLYLVFTFSRSVSEDDNGHTIVDIR